MVRCSSIVCCARTEAMQALALQRRTAKILVRFDVQLAGPAAAQTITEAGDAQWTCTSSGHQVRANIVLDHAQPQQVKPRPVCYTTHRPTGRNQGFTNGAIDRTQTVVDQGSALKGARRTATLAACVVVLHTRPVGRGTALTAAVAGGARWAWARCSFNQSSPHGARHRYSNGLCTLTGVPHSRPVLSVMVAVTHNS
jgi:hypothetical protein